MFNHLGLGDLLTLFLDVTTDHREITTGPEHGSGWAGCAKTFIWDRRINNCRDFKVAITLRVMISSKN